MRFVIVDPCERAAPLSSSSSLLLLTLPSLPALERFFLEMYQLLMAGIEFGGLLRAGMAGSAAEANVSGGPLPLPLGTWAWVP